MATLKESVENHPAVWLLGMLSVGFLAGIATYKGMLEIAALEVLGSDEATRLRTHDAEFEPNRAQIDQLRQQIKELESRTCGYAKEEVDTVHELVKQIDQSRRQKILGHIPGNDWSGVAEDFVFGYNGRPNEQKLILQYFPEALRALGSDALANPRFGLNAER